MMSRIIKKTGKMASHAHSDLPVSPGEYLAEVMNELGLDGNSLATQLGLSVGELDALLDGNTLLTQALAGRLEKATSVPANIWLGLEAEYRAAQTKENSAEAPS